MADINYVDKSTAARSHWLTAHVLDVLVSGRPIFSIDIHPDGSRFVIGGQGRCAIGY